MKDDAGTHLATGINLHPRMQNGIISDHAIIPDINLGKHFYVSPKFHMLTKVRKSPDVAIFSHSGRVTDKARSEEHTSELQSLMRNSYADFCLKQINITRTIPS